MSMLEHLPYVDKLAIMEEAEFFQIPQLMSLVTKYARHDLVLGHECHNPSTLRHPKTGEWLMFHIVRSQCCGSPSGRQA